MRAGIRDTGFGIRQGAPAPAVRFPESRIPYPESRQQGFSLLEVIAAIMLLAIAFTALMKVAGASIGLSHNAAAYSEVAMRARSLLDGAFVGEPVRPGSRSGRFNPQYRWQLDVTPWSPGGPAMPGEPLQLYQLDLTVAWGSPAHPRRAHFRTLRLGTPNLAGNAQAVR
ncbi:MULTISPECIES: type IV pilus modification PilV family protein [Rhodanobacter]|uniref:type IV pilus modification PilV family protein n=1 Tax=Rhodanobacter TaxID=75309 RepID=UPI00041E28FE|nr:MULTISPECIES: prepilin-type N-terminal cleavage/methylation domain-containing protein [Rhodanobacter]UJJ55338.1 prepilin-type N-terminal cleavage/methylation domain-containing protein [Rhodanobacter thiooxydans]